MTAKIRVRVGDIEVDYEGAENFLDKKLPELVTYLSKLAERVPQRTESGKTGIKERGDPGTLASFLKVKNATISQKRRFLATAEWLHRRGSVKLKTRDITKALQDNHQKRIGNPSDTLLQNISDGSCEKAGSEFFVTDEGRTALA